MRFFRWVWNLLRGLFRREPIRHRVVRVREVPDKLAPNVLYVECEGDSSWVAVLICPCGCGCRIDLNLLPDTLPCWRVEVAPDGTPTVVPSVWRTVGCESHFFVRQGHIVWCGSRPG